MGVLPDWMIQRDVKIEPFSEGVKRPGVISYGVTSYGYDARLGYKFKVFKAYPCSAIDPKNFDERMMELVEIPLQTIETSHNTIEIPPHSFVLGESLETFRIPRDTLCIVVGKSTYARCGIIINVTPGEPEWEGKWTIEISNTTPLPARVYAGEGIMQCIFLRSDALCEKQCELLRDLHTNKVSFDKGMENTVYCITSYADKKGKYQNQTGLTNPTVDK